MMTTAEAKEAISTLERPNSPREEWAEELLITCCSSDLESKLNHDELWTLLGTINIFQKLSIADKDLAQSFIDKLSSINNNGN